MAISKDLQAKLDYYEQVYYALDKPVPFKDGLLCHPVLVKDYYNFYNCLGCITMDKTIKTIIGEDGRLKKVSNPKGIGQTYLEYLVDMMENDENGPLLTNQLMDLLSLVFHIDKGLYCSDCGKQISYQEAFAGMDEYVKEAKEKAQNLFNEAVKAEEEKTGEKIDSTIPKELMDKIIQSARIEYIQKAQICPDCGKTMRDVFSIKNNKGVKTLMIKDIEIGNKEFDEFKALIPRQNIIDYDGDKYMDPDLKEELELKAKLQNQDYTQPTLEKQLVCVSVGTGLTFEYLRTIPIRKLSLLLRSVDREKTYYAQLQGAMSGMVEFKEPPKHWIFSDDKRNIAKEMTSLENFTKKFEQVT